MAVCGTDCGCLEGCADGWAYTSEPVNPEAVAELMRILAIPANGVSLGLLHEQLTLF